MCPNRRLAKIENAGKPQYASNRATFWTLLHPVGFGGQSVILEYIVITYIDHPPLIDSQPFLREKVQVSVVFA